MSDDDDKTVFGQKLPDAAPSGKSAPVPPASPPPTVAPVAAPPSDADKTVFGAQLPPAQPPGYVPPAQPGAGRAAPTGGPPPNHEDTWVGGALNPFDAPRPQQGQTPPAYGQQPLYQPQHVPTGADMFPDVQREAPQQAPLQTPRIALDDALKAAGPNTGASSNPLIAAASNLMILLGRLRTGMVELQSGPLIDHVTREIDQYERNLLTAGVAAQDAQDAKYALAASADDIVQNLPGADRGTWMQYAMVPRFFGERDSGIGFFRKMDQAMQAPAQRYNLLELMLTCMSLGFEGQYRTSTNGAVELARVRSAVYETLRRVQPRHCQTSSDVSMNSDIPGPAPDRRTNWRVPSRKTRQRRHPVHPNGHGTGIGGCRAWLPSDGTDNDRRTAGQAFLSSGEKDRFYCPETVAFGQYQHRQDQRAVRRLPSIAPVPSRPRRLIECRPN